MCYCAISLILLVLSSLDCPQVEIEAKQYVPS